MNSIRNRLGQSWSSFRSKVNSRTLTLLVTILLLIAVPVSMVAVDTQQNTRTEAAKEKNKAKKEKAKSKKKKSGNKGKAKKPKQRLQDRNKNKKKKQKKKNKPKKDKRKKNNHKKKKKKKNNKPGKKCTKADNPQKCKCKKNKNSDKPECAINDGDSTDGDGDGDGADGDGGGEEPVEEPEPTEPDEEVEAERTFNLTILLDGIGSAGDAVASNSQGNSDPLSLDRDVFFDLYDEDNDLVAEMEGLVTYDSGSGTYKGTVTAPLLSGAYTAIIDLFNYPEEQVPGIIKLEPVGGVDGAAEAAPINVQEMRFKSGDANDDGEINLLDYNIIAACYNAGEGGDEVCDDPEGADLNDDGAVDLFDVNLFIREISSYRPLNTNSSGSTSTTTRG